MNRYVDELRRIWIEGLGSASYEYLETGLDMFHRHRNSEATCAQAAVGNIAVALELLLKSFIAVKDFGAVFTGIPTALRVLLSASESIPPFYKWGTGNLDFRRYPTIGLDDCIESYFVFFPQMKQVLLTHLDILSGKRAASLHGIMTDVSTFDLDRVGYAALQVVGSLANDPGFRYSWYTPSERDEAFLAEFEDRRRERVAAALKQAAVRIGKEHIEIDEQEVLVAPGWDNLVTRCPVCDANCLLSGYTELSLDAEEEGLEPSLDFFAVSGVCRACGLMLYDSTEIQLARMNTIYDRSGDLDRWFADHGPLAGTGE